MRKQELASQPNCVKMSKCQSVKMKMRWVTKFNLDIKQVLIRKSGTALEQEQSEVSKKGPASEQEQSEVNRRVQTRISSDMSERAASSEEERDRPQNRNRPKSARKDRPSADGR